MTKCKLDNLLTQLELKQSDAVFFNNEEGKFGVPLHFDIQKKLNLINPDAIYVFNKQPFILFFDLTDEKNTEREKEIHKKVWSFDNSPVIFVIKDTEVNIYNALNYIKKDNYSSLEKINISDKDRNVQFSFWNLQSGSTWQWLQEEVINNNTKKATQKRVNERLFQNIKEVRNHLTNGNNALKENDANSLILRLIFIRYLIDREVTINTEYISGKDINEKRECFCKLILQPERLNALFDYLNDRFNGTLFKDSVRINKIQAKFLAGVFSGELQTSGLFKDYFFEIFDFSIIPVELISGIYESLLDEETKELDAAVYTPSFLVDYILTDTIDKYLENTQTSDCKVFEVSVGSGIFLVQSLRRMIEKEVELSGNEDKQKFSERIKEIAKNNLFGIDINEEALKVTCFSIYIALLDYIEPKDISQQYLFPDLIDKNLFKADFFDTDHTYNQIVKDERPNFILGNPPWKKDKSEKHLEWLNKENVYGKEITGKMEIAQSFLLRTKDFMQTDTKVALVVTSTIFYNVSSTTRTFKDKFLNTYCLDKFFDLSPVRRLVFEEKDSPASIVYFRLPKSETEHLENIVNHQSVKINYFLKHFKMLVVEKFDQKEIQQKHFIENNWLFKVALYGNVLDFVLLKKIFASGTINILDLIDNVKMFKGAGIERGKDPKPYHDLIGMPIMENKEIQQDYFNVSEQNTLTEKDINLSRGRNINIFIGNKILFREQNFEESEPLIAFVNENLVFRKGVFSIAAKDDKLIKTLYAFFKSDLSVYFLFLISAAWGVATRPAIRFDDELLKFPIIETDEKTKTELITLVNQFLKSFEEHYDKLNLGEPQPNKEILAQINNIINDLYEINGYEKDLIDYVLDVSRYQFQESKQEKFTRKVNLNKSFLENYANVYLQEFGKVYDDEFMQVEIYSLNHFIAMKFNFSDTEPSKKFVYQTNQTEKRVFELFANKLSISQKTNTANLAESLFIQKDIKGFEENSFYIIKPNEYKCWHRAMAWYDVAEFMEKIEVAEVKRFSQIEE